LVFLLLRQGLEEQSNVAKTKSTPGIVDGGGQYVPVAVYEKPAQHGRQPIINKTAFVIYATRFNRLITLLAKKKYENKMMAILTRRTA
jgi:hypothetical protein